MKNRVDIVLMWVDGNDLKWQDEFSKYSKDDENKKHTLYRDWDNLHFLFRAFEEFVPWVKKIHFITYGHLPVWLNANHPKLNIINHKDYIDSRYLPTFNSHVLETNIYRIKDLSEQFILFNDDTFIVSPIEKNRFFKDGLPCDSLVSNAISSSSGVGHFVLNNLEIINRHFSKKDSLKRNYKKWFHINYRKDILRNLCLLPWPRFTGFVDPHQPQPFLKSTFKEIWSKENKILEKTSLSKFRNCTNVNQYLFRYWQLAKGKFVPISMRDTCYEEITIESVVSGKIEHLMTADKYTMICLNDSEEMNDVEKFEMAKEKIRTYFEQILPNKSSFEK